MTPVCSWTNCETEAEYLIVLPSMFKDDPDLEFEYCEKHAEEIRLHPGAWTGAYRVRIDAHDASS